MPAPLNVDWNAIAAQAAAGATLQELSDHWGIAIGTLKDRCAAGGWKRIAREVQAIKAGVPEVYHGAQQAIQQRPTQPVVSLMQKLGERSKFRAAKVGDKTLKHMQKAEGQELTKQAPAFKCTVDALAKVHGWGDQASAVPSPLVAIQLNGYVPPEA